MKKNPLVTRISEEQILPAGETLVQAFFEDPLCIYTASDPEQRKRIFSWYFTQFVREESSVNAVYIAGDQPDGVAIWMPPHMGEAASEPTERNMPDEIEKRFGQDAYQHFTTAFSYFEAIHHQVIRGPHWYLELLGVAPHCQGQGIGKALLAPVLQKADEEALPCYLETFTARNVPFYTYSGFQAVEVGIEPSSQLSFWAMRREPQKVY